jgi:hypothetical protein
MAGVLPVGIVELFPSDIEARAPGCLVSSMTWDISPGLAKEAGSQGAMVYW